PSATEQSVLSAWINADLGIDATNAHRVVAELAPEKRSMEQSKVRYGLHSIQRTFLSFIEAIGLREELVPNGRGEVVFYNLGKFSQLISDFETIHFHSQPKDKYATFAKFLEFQADG